MKLFVGASSTLVVDFLQLVLSVLYHDSHSPGAGSRNFFLTQKFLSMFETNLATFCVCYTACDNTEVFVYILPSSVKTIRCVTYDMLLKWPD